MSTTAMPAIEVLRRAGVDHRVVRYDHDDAADSYGREAVEALGVDEARVFKTLVAATARRSLVVAVTPVVGLLDLKALAVALGTKRAAMADPAEAERATGYVVGGISPLGQKKRLPVVVDVGALSWATIFVSAGRRGVEVELAPTDLVRLTEAIIAPIGRFADS